MREFWSLEPEVAGELGSGSLVDTSVHPPRVSKLTLMLSGWLGDELVETFPCYVVTESLGTALVSAGLTGFELDDVDIDLPHTSLRTPNVEPRGRGSLTTRFRGSQPTNELRSENVTTGARVESTSMVNWRRWSFHTNRFRCETGAQPSCLGGRHTTPRWTRTDT